MYQFVRTANVQSGKFGEALAFAKEVVEHLAKTHDLQLEVSMPVSGNPYRLCWSNRFENLSQFEEFQTRLMGDAKYREILGKAGSIFISGAGVDEIWRIL